MTPPVPTHRPLPEDPLLASVPEDERINVAGIWRRRSRNELSTSTVFASLTRALVAFRAPHEIVREAASAVADEVRHAEICLHVARTYWADCPDPDPSEVVEAAFESQPHLGTLLYVVSQSCINEGVATAYLQQCLDEAERPLARAAVRDILQDEIHHARFGWTLLATDAVKPEWRAGIGDALPELMARVTDAWLEQVGTANVPAGHGAIGLAAMREVLLDAYDALILPGFDVVGVDIGAGRRWLRDAFKG
jgi:hypothetical protein